MISKDALPLPTMMEARRAVSGTRPERRMSWDGQAGAQVIGELFRGRDDAAELDDLPATGALQAAQEMACGYGLALRKARAVAME